MIAQTGAFVENGFRTVKVKAGDDQDADVEIVSGIPQTFGDTLKIRVYSSTARVRACGRG